MAYCLSKENISARTFPNQRMNKVFIDVEYKVFIAKKQCLVRNIIIYAKMIDINTKIIYKFATIPHGIFNSLK